LPYDFDQIRVYAWNVKKHRYEGAYRKRDVAGYLPVTLLHQVEETTGPYAGVPVPVFTVKVATQDTLSAANAGAGPALDPQTGMVKPVPTEDETFALEGETVKRLANAQPVTMPPPGSRPTPRAEPAQAPVATPGVAASEKRRDRKHERKRRKKRTQS